jgi:hypothetical protein
MESVDHEIVNISSSPGISMKGLSTTAETSVTLSALRTAFDLLTS